MISDFDDDKIVASVNTWTGYPKIFDLTDNTFRRMVELIEFVEKSTHAVMPCSAFWNQKQLVENGSFNARGAHAFRFWFKNIESAKEFFKLYGGDLEEPPVLPRRA